MILLIDSCEFSSISILIFLKSLILYKFNYLQTKYSLYIIIQM